MRLVGVKVQWENLSGFESMDGSPMQNGSTGIQDYRTPANPRSNIGCKINNLRPARSLLHET